MTDFLPCPYCNQLGESDPSETELECPNCGHKFFKTTCLVCKKPIQVGNEELVGCVVCDDCPFPVDPCETCGKKDCDGECCNCVFCVARRSTK